MKSDEFVDCKYVCVLWMENGTDWTESWRREL